MSDGGNKESGKDHEQKFNKSRGGGGSGGGGGGDEFGLGIARIAVAQICEEIGFQSFQQSALEALSDVAVRYLRELGKASHFYANLAGRTDCNVFDIIQGLEDLGFAQGFTGSSEINRCIVGSGAAKEITRFVNLTDEIPLARPVPRFPVIRNRKPIRSFLQIGEDPVGKHIPAWLPAFPDPQTYVQNSMCSERESDLCKEKFEQVKQHKKADWSLLNLQQRLLCNGSAASTSVDPGDAAKSKRAADSNPFLAPPLQSVDKEVSPAAFPAKLSNETVKEKRVSVLETFAPVIEAAKSGLCDTRIVEKKILPSKRPTVHFKLGTGKKSLDMPLEFSLQKKAVGKKDLSLGRDDEKDERKRRAEQILKGSMENPEEFV